MKTGRRTRLTDGVRAKVGLALGEGHYIQDAAAAGVGTSTLKQWLADARAVQDGLDRPSGQKQPARAALLDLLDVVDAADYAASELGLSAVRKAAEAGDWRAGAWFLEHRYPTTWGRMARPADTPADTTPDTYAESRERLMDYLRSRPEPTCATCGADAVDAHGGSLPLVQRLRPQPDAAAWDAPDSKTAR